MREALFLIVCGGAAVGLMACSSNPLISPSSSAPVVDPVVLVGQPETRDLGPSAETIWNCGSGGGPVVKSPSMSVATNWAVEWEVGGVVGTGVRIGDGVIPGGVDLSASLEGHNVVKLGEDVEKRIEWSLPAEPNTVVVYTLMWREIWQSGYVNVRLSDQQVVRVTVRYRTGIQSEIVGKRVQPCNSESPSSPQVLTTSQAQQRPLAVTSSSPGRTLRTFTEEDLNALLGKDNWRCIDGAPNGVSINSLPANFVVRFPLVRIDFKDKFYYEGDLVPVAGHYATGWLASALPNNTCSMVKPNATRSEIDRMFGIGNWHCLPDYPTGIRVVDMPSRFVVQRPVMFVDKGTTRYYHGEPVPEGGPATVWFPANISSECP